MTPLEAGIAAIPPKSRIAPGMRFGMFTVERFERNKVKRMAWWCKCDCGEVRHVSESDLRLGKSKSCGCLSRKAVGARCLTHGDTTSRVVSPEYRSWAAMKNRCLNPNGQDYADYGGKGITVCQRWIDSYEEFLEDVGRRPSLKHSLDRYPNGSGNYEPGNVRWATPFEQASNRSSVRRYTLNGKTLNMTEWAKESGVAYSTIVGRLNKGMSLEQAINGGKH